MAVKQLPKISDLPEPPDRLVGDQERFDVLTFNSLKAQKKMVNEDLNKTLIPALNQFAVDVNASVDAAALSERNAHDSEEVAKRKAGEASGSAGAAKVSEDNAKVSETNALASKNAAALSAESAESARIAAEAARDEAQDLANVGYVSEGHAGLAKVDGKTTQADAGGVITAKDVAIGGNLEDLASKRGQIGTPPIQSFTKTAAVDAATLNLNDDKWWVNGEYSLYLRSEFFSFTPVVNNTPLEVSGNYSARLRGANVYHTGNGIQEFSIAIGGRVIRMYYRTRFFNSDNTFSYYPWREAILTSNLGDGLRITNGIISVPEMQGATASTDGTSGLVPPATAGQQESFLTGGGEYKPALTKISDSVNLADSKTAASAKAVKAAYDLANGKQAALGFTPVQQGGGKGQGNNKIYIGYSKSGLKAQANTLDLGNVVTTSAGCTKAPSAALADNATNARNLIVTDDGQTAKFNWDGRSTGQPEWVWGGNSAEFGNMYTWNPINFSVNYATNSSNAWQTTIVPNVRAGDNNNIPAGGTWTFLTYKNGQVEYGAVAGGTYISGRWIAIRNA